MPRIHCRSKFYRKECAPLEEKNQSFKSRSSPDSSWVKRLSTDLAARVRASLKAKILKFKRGSIAHSLSLSAHRPDVTEEPR